MSQTIRTDWGVRWTAGPESGKVWGYTGQIQAEHGVSQQRLVDWDGEVVSVGSSRVDLQACKLEYSIVSPK